jgi:formylmethanofuran dehydrogenase subunit E/inosine-uridine nucleoside N-ribohydrolase
MTQKLINSVCLAFIALSVTTALAGAPAGRDIIVDTDMGLDDVRAIFALLADTSSSVLGIVTVEGSASLGKGTDNLIGLLERLELDGMPVFRGARLLDAEAPPWRNTANGLAGNPFPPPRHITAREAHEGSHALIAGREPHSIYLALGPLSNLAAMEPDEIGSIGAIWLPAVIDNGILEGWNLSFDQGSAKDVLSRAGEVIIVDVGPAGRLDARAILDSVDGSSVAARWIDGLLSGAEGHLMIYDEIAALAAVSPGLRAIDEERYNIAWKGNELRLEQSNNGTIRIARVTDMEGAARELVTLWERETEGGRRHNHSEHEDVPIEPELYIKTFHGHLGPYLVLGFRMGRIALRELDSEGYFGLRAVVHSRLNPPASCLIDGVQLGSGCTLGKRNIEIMETDGPAFAEFENEQGEGARISLKSDITGLIARMIRESGVEKAGERIFHMSEDSLFDVRRHE